MTGNIINGFVLGWLASPSCPSNAEEIRAGTRGGSSPALAVALGAVAGDALVLLVLVLGLQPILEEVQTLTTLLWAVGAGVLTYVAVGIFREAGQVVSAEQEASAGDGTRGLARAAWTGFAITTFNPFTVAWWMGLLGPALAGGEAFPVAFAVSVLAGAAVWFLGLVVILRVGRRWLTRRVRRVILYVTGAGALAYAGYFAWQAVATLGA